MLTPENYVTGFSVVMAMYSLQMLFIPQKLNDDHFASKLTPTAEFFCRGGTCGYLA